MTYRGKVNLSYEEVWYDGSSLPFFFFLSGRHREKGRISQEDWEEPLLPVIFPVFSLCFDHAVVAEQDFTQNSSLPSGCSIPL